MDHSYLSGLKVLLLSCCCMVTVPPAHGGCRYDVPLVADIHFQPAVAMMVAECFEKIRINPGNFADGRKTFEVINYDDPKQFAEERDHIEEVSMEAAAAGL